jgi:DNA polymerase-3 subunit gamma/tau
MGVVSREEPAIGRGELGQLKQQIASLEQKLGALLSGGGSPVPGVSSSNGGLGGGNVQSRPNSATGNGAASQAPRITAIPRLKLNTYVDARSSSAQSLAKWPQVLQRVKEERVTVHAWLVDGEPVSFADNTMLVAFRNTIHRETTEKPANKGVIEGVLTGIFGSPTRLLTVLQKDWQEALAENAGKPKSEPAVGEELQLIPEDEAEAKDEPWIDEAVRLFGEQLVTIKDD